MKIRLKAAIFFGLYAAGWLVIALSLPVAADAVDAEHNVTAASARIENTTIVIQRLSDDQQWIANHDRAK